jgi:hypothetical protein
MSLGLARRDNPHQLVCFVLILDCMDYKQQQNPVRHPDRLPPLFSIDLAVQSGKMHGVVEHERSGIEIDAMLAQVALILSLVPIKAHAHRLDTSVYTKRHIQIVSSPQTAQNPRKPLNPNHFPAKEIWQTTPPNPLE